MKSKYNKVYIAGPMSGLPNFNIEAFDRAEKFIGERGDIAVNPAVLAKKWLEKNPDRNMSKGEYDQLLLEGLKQIHNCDAILMLPGWQNSNGAKAELSLALIRKIPVEVMNF